MCELFTETELSPVIDNGSGDKVDPNQNDPDQTDKNKDVEKKDKEKEEDKYFRYRLES